MHDQIRYLFEKDAIVGTVNALFSATDEWDWARVRECFAPRVLFDVRSVTGQPEMLDVKEIVGGG
jgi:hypothetical protein